MLSTMILTSLYSNMYWVIAAAAAQLVILSMSSSTNAIRTEAERGCEPPCGRSSSKVQLQPGFDLRGRKAEVNHKGQRGKHRRPMGPGRRTEACLVVFLPAVVGKAVIGWVVEHIRRPSVLMFILGGIIATSVVVMSATGPTYELHKITRLIWRIV
eukprot:s427_g14.t3